MTRMLMGSLVALVCSVGLAAQTPTGTTKPQSPQTKTGQPTQKPATQGDDKSATLRGCLRAGDETGQYVLADASATSGATLKNARVQLVGSPAGVNLKEHVGHTVEVTGMLMGGDRAAGAGARTGGAETGKPTAANPGSSAGGKPGAGTAGAGTAGAGTGARLNVKAVKHVKEGC